MVATRKIFYLNSFEFVFEVTKTIIKKDAKNIVAPLPNRYKWYYYWLHI